MDNQAVTPDQLRKIRRLDGFDLVMLISEIHDHGWPAASVLLKDMPEGSGNNDPKVGANPKP